MFPIKCSECKQVLEFNYIKSLDQYLNKVDYIRDSENTIIDIAVNSPMFFYCLLCDKEFLYSSKDLENKLKETISSDIKQYRKKYVFTKVIQIQFINPDNGFKYCGKCAGVDNQGGCYKDIIKVCPFVVENEI